MITQSLHPLADIQGANKTTAARFVGAFNDGDWDTVREVVADGFVFHHPIGGTVEAGPRAWWRPGPASSVSRRTRGIPSRS